MEPVGTMGYCFEQMAWAMSVAKQAADAKTEASAKDDANEGEKEECETKAEPTAS